MFDLDSCVAFITKKSAKKIADAFNDRLMEKGVSRVQWTALYFLGKYGSMSQNDLADKMDLKSSTIARLIDRLERDGYVKRIKDPEDRRITKLLLTEEGRGLRELLIPEGEKMSEIITQGISEEKINIFLQVLRKMTDNVEK